VEFLCNTRECTHGIKREDEEVKGDLKVWNMVEFGNMENTKKAILKEIETLDCQDCNGALMERGYIGLGW